MRVREVVGLSGYNLLAMVRRGFFYTFLMIFLREHLALPITSIALIGATNAVMSTLGQLLVWGKYSDRTDRRAGLMVLGEVIGGLGYLAAFGVFRVSIQVCPPGVTLGLVVVTLGAVEFFWSMTDVGYRAAIAQVTTTKNRGTLVGAIELIGLVGLGGGLLLAGVLYRNGAGFLDGTLWYLAAAFILAGVPLIRTTLGHLDRVRLNDGNGGDARRLAPGYRRYMVVLVVSVLGLWAFQQNHTFFVRLPETAGATDEQLSLIRTAFWVAGGLAAPLWGLLIDRMGSRRGFAITLLLAALAPLLFLLTRTFVFAAATLALFGIFLTAFRTASYSLAADLTPENARGRHFAFYNAVMSAGWGLAALLIGGPVADACIAAGKSEKVGYEMSFLTGTGLALTGLLLFLIIRPGRTSGGSRA